MPDCLLVLYTCRTFGPFPILWHLCLPPMPPHGMLPTSPIPVCTLPAATGIPSLPSILLRFCCLLCLHDTYPSLGLVYSLLDGMLQTAVHTAVHDRYACCGSATTHFATTPPTALPALLTTFFYLSCFCSACLLARPTTTSLPYYLYRNIAYIPSLPTTTRIPAHTGLDRFVTGMPQYLPTLYACPSFHCLYACLVLLRYSATV